MALFTVSQDTDLSPEQAWSRLVDWPAHGRHVPLTSVRVTTPAAEGVGTVFVARTGLGPAGFDDVMEVTQWRPPAGGQPGKCRIEKRGKVMLGWAEFTVAPRGAG